MSRFILPRRLFFLTLLVILVASAASPLSGSAMPEASSAQLPALATTDVPVQVFPNSTIPIKRVMFIWTYVDNATQYYLQVNQGSTLVRERTFDSTVCVSGTCSALLGKDLPNGGYSWRIRALVGGSWRAYSPWLGFNVSFANTGGFSSSFTNDAADWVIHKGTWQLESSNYFATPGVSGRTSSISHLNNYSTLNYEARMKRIGCAGCANVLIIRGNPTLDATGWWNTEYTFDYSNTGLFSVWRDNNGSYVALKNWTYTSAINQGGWNTLRVTAEGSQLKFYINGVLVWSGTDGSYSSGRVGIGMYRSTTSTGDKLYVDWAQLSTSAPYTTGLEAAAAAEVVDESGVEIPGGDRNMAPEVPLPAP